MIDKLLSKVTYHWDYYVESLQYQWNHMTPMKYGALLIFVFLAGFVLLKSNLRRT